MSPGKYKGQKRGYPCQDPERERKRPCPLMRDVGDGVEATATSAGRGDLSDTPEKGSDKSSGIIGKIARGRMTVYADLINESEITINSKVYSAGTHLRAIKFVCGANTLNSSGSATLNFQEGEI